jgi:hypothetical protein
MALKRKKLIRSKKVKTIQEVEKNPTVLRNEIVKCSVLPPLSSSVFLWEASILKRKAGVRHILINEKT